MLAPGDDAGRDGPGRSRAMLAPGDDAGRDGPGRSRAMLEADQEGVSR
jgi:hypothetical protein